MSSSLNLEGPSIHLFEDGVVDFQSTRCLRYVKPFQASLERTAIRLAEAAGCVSLSDLSYLKAASEDILLENVYAVFDFINFKTSKRKKILCASWSPFVILKGGQQVLALKASYGSKGAQVSGVSLWVDGKHISSRCRKLSVAEKILLTHIKTYVRPDEQREG